MSKLVDSLRQAVELCGLQDGMRISFHHALRNGDYVLNLVMDQLSRQGFKDLTLNTSGLFPVHTPLIEHIRSGVVTAIEADYIAAPVGRPISEGLLDRPVLFQSHGGRAGRMAHPSNRIDVAFIAASVSDPMGNCSGKDGKNAFGSLGYALAEAAYAKKVVVVTDTVVPYPLADFSIPETQVDCVVCVDSIGDTAQISTGTTKLSKDPIQHRIARTAANVIAHSGYLRDGFHFQTGSGGATLACAKYLKEILQREGIRGGCCIGGMTGYLSELLREGYFQALLDVQCFDLEAVRSLQSSPSHREISACHYADARAKSSAVRSLDIAVLGATQIDTDFNVNVHTDSEGYIMGGAGGHIDVAAGAKLTIILAPLLRHRIPIVVDRVLCRSTPGSMVDLLVTEHGVAVNPRREDLKGRLFDAGIPLVDIHALQETAERISGRPELPRRGDRIIGTVLDHMGEPLDTLLQVGR